MLFSQRSACDRCRALKSRCSRENGSKKCERCQRLQIDCFYSPPRRMGRPAKKRLSQDITTQPTPPASYRRSSTMSNMTVHTTQSDAFPSNANDAGDFHYGLGIMPSPSAGHEWSDNFEDPLLGFLQEHDAKMLQAEWINTGTLGFLDHHENALAVGPHDLPLTPTTTVGSMPNHADDSWASGCDQGPSVCQAESYAGNTLPPSPEVSAGSTEPAIKRLLDLQSLLITRRMSAPQETEEPSALINTTVHATETLIDVVESLPPLKPNVEATQPASPTSCWGGQALDAGTFTPSAPPPAHAAPELHDSHQHHQRQQHPDLALAISLFTTNHLLLLDSYDELLVALRARLQCSRQSRAPSPGSDFSLPQHFFSGGPGGQLSKLNLVSSFDLDVNSVVFLLSRMMKRLQKSMQDRFAPLPAASTPDAHLKGRGFPFSNASLNFDFQDGATQSMDGALDLSPAVGHAPIASLGSYASWEISKRHQSVTESLRVIRWLADEL
ncbi:hypothetical protein LX36DRAFT_657239 [Colletotrichum falcatum]|nr:hypothetical protein LX36DRAFT_657239 [Colletotrichum falcatum]